MLWEFTLLLRVDFSRCMHFTADSFSLAKWHRTLLKGGFGGLEVWIGGLEDFVPAVAYHMHIYLALRAAFMEPGSPLFSPTLYSTSRYRFLQKKFRYGIQM